MGVIFIAANFLGESKLSRSIFSNDVKNESSSKQIRYLVGLGEYEEFLIFASRRMGSKNP
jgi:hypothetical protein